MLISFRLVGRRPGFAARLFDRGAPLGNGVLAAKYPERVADVGVRQTPVGDRYVLEAMRAGGYTLGGEQSGHVIMSQYATTGDGILTALHVLERMARRASLADAGLRGDRLPQVLVNVAGVDESRAATTPCWPPRSPRRRARSATPGGCCCGPRAPSRWCG